MVSLFAIGFGGLLALGRFALGSGLRGWLVLVGMLFWGWLGGSVPFSGFGGGLGFRCVFGCRRLLCGGGGLLRGGSGGLCAGLSAGLSLWGLLGFRFWRLVVVRRGRIGGGDVAGLSVGGDLYLGLGFIGGLLGVLTGGEAFWAYSRAVRPSRTESAMRAVMSLMARMASSLEGMG